jgi:hypothetical protein
VQGETYLAFIDAEMSREWGRRERIDRQAASVVASSGTLLTLSTGLLTFFKGREDASKEPVPLLLLGLGLYLLAAAVGIMASSSKRYEVTAPSTMLAMLTEHWTDTETTARNSVGRLMVRSTGTLRIGNNAKSQWLLTAVILEILAVATSGFTIYMAA